MAIAAMAQDNDDPDLESSLLRALQLRAAYLKGQADSLTLPAVRRLLERDLGLKTSHLDAHKALIKGLVDKVLNEAGNDAEDEDLVTGKPRKRKKKMPRVVEDLQDGEDEPRRTNDGNGVKKRKLLKKVDARQEKPTPIDEEKLEDLGNSSEKADDIDIEQPVSRGNLLEELEDRDADKSENVGNPLEKAGQRDAEQSDFQGNSPEKPSKGDEEAAKKHGDVPEGPTNAEKEVVEKEGDTQQNLPESNEDILEEGNVLSQGAEEKDEKEEPPHAAVGIIDENAIRSALMRRANELKSQAESLTVKTVRYLLEEDLGLEPDGLDVHKQFIRKLVDELLRDEDPTLDQLKVGKAVKKQAQVSSQGKRKKKGEVKFAAGKSSMPDEENEESKEKLQGNGELSDSGSEGRRPGKVRIQKKKSTEVKTKTIVAKKSIDVKRQFSANVERLREILKAVGVGVSPIVYKKAKQAPEHERDEVLVKELEARLSQEGLSPYPSEKEIKKVKARLEKKKDLDGIEHSNIVAEPRRSRAAANSWFTPRQNKYSEVVETEEEDPEDQDSDDDAKPIVTGTMDD